MQVVTRDTIDTSVLSTLRRRLLLGSTVALFAEPMRGLFAQSRSVKAIAFDGFVIIDPRPVAMREAMPRRLAHWITFQLH
jgi:hypothetical protein